MEQIFPVQNEERRIPKSNLKGWKDVGIICGIAMSIMLKMRGKKEQVVKKVDCIPV